MKSKKIVLENKQHWLEERAKDITSTEISALFGLSPYTTYFELWHNKKNETFTTISENERMAWGNALEYAIASEAARTNNWQQLEPRKDYYRIEELRAGSSFDYEAVVNGKNTILEIKNVDGFIFNEKWKEDSEGNIEAPYHIELQMQYQLLISGYEQGYIVALVGGNKLVTLLRTPDYVIQGKMIETLREFWSSIVENKASAADYRKDYDFIISMYQEVTPKRVLEDDRFGELAMKYKQATEEEGDIKITKQAIKAKVFEAIDDFEKVKGEINGRKFSISCGMRKDGRRNFSVYLAKEN
jgi:putative phage-type endonuclease